MNVLHHDLEAIKASRLGYLDFSTETLHQVLVDNAIGGSEEGKDVGDEETLVVVQSLVPVVEILGKINLLGRPEGSFGLLVHLPDLFETWLASVAGGTREAKKKTRRLTSWYLMGKRTNRWGFSCRRGSCASSGLIVEAVVGFTLVSSTSGRSGMPTIGL